MMKKRIFITLIAGFLLGACGYISQPTVPMYGGYAYQKSEKYNTNGEQIYFTAVDKNGQYIAYTGGPNTGGMMMRSSYLSCASCHGNDGQGGTHYMHMQVMDAPAITYTALIDMKREDSGGTPTEYSLDDLRGVVVEGHDTAGDILDRNMPRWQMNDDDLADLLIFLKTLP